MNLQHLSFPFLRVLEYLTHSPAVVVPSTTIDHMVPFLEPLDEGLDRHQYAFRLLPSFVRTYSPIGKGPLVPPVPPSRHRVCPNVFIRTRPYSVTAPEDPLHILRYIRNADDF